jgi:hypothetical protein
MGVCNTTKHKYNMPQSDKALPHIIIKQDKISDKTIFEGMLY